jgi:hypothetical protein
MSQVQAHVYTWLLKASSLNIIIYVRDQTREYEAHAIYIYIYIDLRLDCASL